MMQYRLVKLVFILTLFWGLHSIETDLYFCKLAVTNEMLVLPVAVLSDVVVFKMIFAVKSAVMWAVTFFSF